jgi:hypothetical protein
MFMAVCGLQGVNGAALYDYEYELDSTRGKKRIFNTVTITSEGAPASLQQWHRGRRGNVGCTCQLLGSVQ